MSGNTSATGGFLQPLAPPPIEDELLTNMMQATIVGCTGLDPTLVRPRWQRTPPKQPTADTDWCAIGSISRTPMDYPYLAMLPDNSNAQMQRHEYIDWMASFYGPNSDALAGMLRDGLYIRQNWELLNTYGIRLHEVRETTLVPDLVNSQFIGHTDLPFTVVRQLNRVYPILYIISASGTITCWKDGVYNSPPGAGIPNEAPLGTFILGTNTLAYYHPDIVASFNTALGA